MRAERSGRGHPGRGPRRSGSRQAVRRPEPVVRHCVEFTFLPGLEDVVRDELDRALGSPRVRPVPGRDDAVQATVTGSLRPLLRLRTVVAPFVALRFDVPRPQSLLDGAHFPRLLEAVRRAASADPAAPSRSFRFDAAGRDTPAFRAVADQLAAATRMRHDPEEGTTLVRFRRAADERGWDVLVRLGVRPLSARPWRELGYVAAANATVAAAMVRLTRPRPDDAVANLMCGSGTLLIERLLVAPARRAVGVDLSTEAVQAATANVAAAGLTDRVELVTSDIADPGWARRGPFDVLLADPPWGDKIGRHDENEALHDLLLRRGHDVAVPGARFAVLTHEIRIMGRCLQRAQRLWELEKEHRVFNKGHHPRIYLLRRRPD
jgi:tRNA (guanine6-N2)-methyltransferase